MMNKSMEVREKQVEANDSSCGEAFQTVNMHKTGRHSKREKIIFGILAAGICAILIAAGIGRYQQTSYDYIDLPIVLSNEDEVVETIRQGLTNRNAQIHITFTTRGQYKDQLEALTAALVEKALAPTGDPKQGDYLRFQYGGYKVRYSSPENEDGSHNTTIKIIPSYYTTAEREKAVDRAVEMVLSDARFTSHTSDYDKIKTIHDYIVDRCEYDWRNSNLSHRHIKSTAYGALINGEASCQGYSVAMYRLLMEAGIDCRIITGEATSPETGQTEYHAWNLVCLDGTWYNVDVSWDDQTESYDYFLKSDQSFASHVREAQYDSEAFRTAYPVSQEDWAKGNK